MSRLPSLRVVVLYVALACVQPGNALADSPTVRIRHVSLMSAEPLPVEVLKLAERYFTDHSFPSSSLRAESTKMARRFYIRAGYLDARVTAMSIERAPDGWLDLQFEVHAGKLYHYSTVGATGTTVFKPAELVAMMKLKPGESVNTWRMLDGLSTIREKYFCRGYLRAEAVPLATIDAAQQAERLVIVMREGARFRIAKVSSAMLNGPVADVLLADPLLQPGEFFEPCEITKAARRDISREQAEKTPFTFSFSINSGTDTVDLRIETGFDFGYGEMGRGAGFGGGINVN